MSIETLLERLKQARAKREADLAAARRRPPTAAARLGQAHAPGDRVFDTETGQHGEVLHGNVDDGGAAGPAKTK